ncbi:MAG: hypothetical protein CMG63_04750 [Candidatus Marinimicrobia bacterium]|nr:hypothetical protein [Candidatus Neomarinimicrobiota bacterium]
MSLLSKELSKSNDVTIILFDEIIDYEFAGKLININCVTKKSIYGKTINVLNRTLKLKKIFKKENFDKIFAFMESAYLPSILTRFPIIASLRNNPEKSSLFITKYILPKAKYIVCVSKNIEKALREDFKILNVITIYNPVNLKSLEKHGENLSKYQPFLLGIGRLHEQKNFELLINAFSKTKARERAKLLILGDGHMKKQLQKMVRELNLESKVYLMGQRDNIVDYYIQSKIFILSSIYEGFPNVLVEALANQCPIISTNCPTGPSEIINNYKNGILVENGNETQMCKAIDKLFFNKDLINTFKNNAIKSVEYLDIKIIAQKWLEVNT